MRITGQFAHLPSAKKLPRRQAYIGNTLQQKDLQLPGVLSDQIPAVLEINQAVRCEPAVLQPLCGQIQQSSLQNGLSDTPETAEGTGLALRRRLPDDKRWLYGAVSQHRYQPVIHRREQLLRAGYSCKVQNMPVGAQAFVLVGQ